MYSKHVIINKYASPVMTNVNDTYMRLSDNKDLKWEAKLFQK